MAFWVFFFLIFGSVPLVPALTLASDVQALQVIYTSLNSPPQLTGWIGSGGDPCVELWKGVSCEGSAVVSIEISGLGLNGTMGYALSSLISLRNLDMSNNNIHDTIPYQLPPNLTSLSGDRRRFHESYFPGDLGPFFQQLYRGSSEFLELIVEYFFSNNQLTGSLNNLISLPLTTLNVANNNFSGWIPQELKSIENFIYDGNSFDNSPAPPPPPFTPPPPGRSRDSPRRPGSGGGNHTASSSDSSSSNSKKGLSVLEIVGIILGAIIFVLIVLVAFAVCIQKRKRKNIGLRASSGRLSIGTSVNTEVHEHRVKSVAAVADIKPLPAEKMNPERLQAKNGSVKRIKSPITATSYTVASLQSATNSFSQECIVGEGSLGRVYKAEFPNGKIMAIKKIDNAALSLQEEDNFLEAVSNMSRLRHTNIVTLNGYCVEHGQRLLVYEFIGNGSLHDMLHFAEDSSKTLTWNARVRVALGTARALEYLHEVCLPSVVHRNLKTANILLDEELNPHLSDSGLAALTPNTERQVNTLGFLLFRARKRVNKRFLQVSTQMVGSFGYSAPEFALSGIYTVKSDVYSFGVVMLELLTGRKPLDSTSIGAFSAKSECGKEAFERRVGFQLQNTRPRCS
ncbi:Protein STRUBBELIG-RECEPTOR FAMILY 8, partial [Cucurbita argyrosperma subsp. argyrosperma]